MIVWTFPKELQKQTLDSKPIPTNTENLHFSNVYLYILTVDVFNKCKLLTIWLES